MSKKQVKTDEELLQDALVPVEEQPCEIPSHWKWVRLDYLSEMTDFVANGSFKSLRDNVTVIDEPNYAMYVRLTDLREGLGHENQKYVDEPSYSYLSKSFLRGGEILIANIGANVGESLIMPQVDMPATIAPNMIIIRPSKLIHNLFLQLYLSSSMGKATLLSLVSGSGQPKLNKTQLKTLPIPLPPLDEQKRIANKIEQMLDKINQSKQLIEEAKQTFELRRAAILKKAFSGELTKKWRSKNYSTVNDLLEELELCKQKKIDFEIPSDLGYKLFDIPSNWKWIRLENLIEFTAYGTSTKTSDEYGVPVIRMGNISEGKILMENFKYLPFDHPDVSKYTLEVNDILFNRTNSYELVGKSAIVNELQAGKMTYASYLVNVRLFMKEILSEYICQYINSHIGRGYLLSMVTQQVGQANINATKLASLMVPLPPVTEIKLITDILNKLKLKEEELQSKLDLKTSITSITSSILHSAFQGKLMNS